MFPKIPPPVGLSSVVESKVSVQPGQKLGRRYRLGDTVDLNGARGIVFFVSEDGEHGSIVSLEEWSAPWYVSPHVAALGDELPLKLDGGRGDCELIRTLPDWENHFPAFQKCHAYGGDSGEWWLPSYTELTELYGAFNGGPPGTINPDSRSAFNRCLCAAGGKALSDGVYWSSTSPDGRRAYCLDFTSGLIRHYFNYQYDWRCYHSVRAVAAF